MLLASQRCGGKAVMTGVLEWMDAGSLGRTGRGAEEVVSVISWSAWSSTWGWVRSQGRVYGSGLKGGQGEVTL